MFDCSYLYEIRHDTKLQYFISGQVYNGLTHLINKKSDSFQLNAFYDIRSIVHEKQKQNQNKTKSYFHLHLRNGTFFRAVKFTGVYENTFF